MMAKSILRGYRSGVWYGTVDKTTDKWIYLSNARQVRRWYGALDLSVLSVKGPDVSNAGNRITVPVRVRVSRNDVSAQYEVSEAAAKAFDAVPHAT